MRNDDSAHYMRSAFMSKERSAEEMIEATLKKVESHNPKLNCFLSIFHERAMEKAKELDKRHAQKGPVGKLAGIPIAIKDNILMKQELTTCGSKFLENYRAPYSATVTRLLEEQDAIIIGKTNMDEFAMGGSGIHSAYSIAKNPWDLALTPGGSSSGSSSAVAARLCPIALGSDTGGSIRQPASFTGLTGFKPTYGRVSRYGLVAFGSSLDQIGPLTLTAKDAALVMEVIGQPCRQDSTSIATPSPRYTAEIEQPIKGTRIGVPWSFLEQLQGEPRQKFEEAIEVYKSLGVEIVDVDLSVLKYGIAIYYILGAAEASTNLARFDGIRYGVRSKNAKTLEEIYQLSRAEGFGSEVKNRILLGTFVLSSANQQNYYNKAQKVRTIIIKKMREAFEKCDVIALPSAPGTAFPLKGGVSSPLDEYLQDLYTVGANLAGIPAISIPNGLSALGKPYGLQLMGPQLQDARVLRYAHAFQMATDFTSLNPPGFGDE